MLKLLAVKSAKQEVRNALVNPSSSPTAGLVPSGIGLRHPHTKAFLSPFEFKKPEFLEIHSENYFGGGLARHNIKKIRQDNEISMHGVGLSLGRFDGLDKNHINKLVGLANEISPFLVSDHLSFCGFGTSFTPDLLPLPLSKQAMQIMQQHIDEIQNALKRQFLVENPSNYIALAFQDYEEADFLIELAKKTGCGILLDVNNIAVSNFNTGLDANKYLEAFNGLDIVKEIHLAGHQRNSTEFGDVIIDTHGNKVFPEVWDLYKKAISILGDIPTLIEWDTDIPPLEILLNEAQKANEIKQEILLPSEMEFANA